MAGTDGAFIVAGDGFLIAKYALMGAAGVGGRKMGMIKGLLLVSGFWFLVTGCRTLVVYSWLLVSDPIKLFVSI